MNLHLKFNEDELNYDCYKTNLSAKDVCADDSIFFAERGVSLAAGGRKLSEYKRYIRYN